MASGAGLKQIVVVPAGLPGAANSIFSAKQTVTMTTGGGGHTVVPDIGVLLVMPLPASVTVEIQDPANTWTVIVPASTTAWHAVPSDATNIRFTSTDTSTNRTGTYYVVQ